MADPYLWLLVASALLSAVSQVLLKCGANRTYKHPVFEYVNPWVISGYGLLMITTVLTLAAFTHVEFKNAPVIEALGYVFVLVLSRMILGEKFTKRKLLGNALILAGIAVFYL